MIDVVTGGGIPDIQRIDEDLYKVFSFKGNTRVFGIYSKKARKLIVPIEFTTIVYLLPGFYTVSLRPEPGKLPQEGIFSIAKQRVLVHGYNFHFVKLTDDLIQVWAGRCTGLYSLKKEELVLAVNYDSIRFSDDGLKLLAVTMSGEEQEMAVP